MSVSTIVIVILCIALPIIVPSQQWLIAHNLIYLPLILGGAFLLFMVALTLVKSGSIFNWYDYCIVILFCLYEGWTLIKTLIK